MIASRSADECRKRYETHLDPSISEKPWTENDDARLLDLYAEHGNKWTVIASVFGQDRSDLSIR